MQQLWYPNVDTAITGNPVGTPVGKFSTIAAAVAAQTETVFAGVVPQVGTAAGILVGPGTLPATDDFFNGFFVVNTDATPSNGLPSAYARVTDYDGATRTFTLDNGVDLSGEASVSLIEPVQVWLTGNLTENVTIDKNVVLNLAGHELSGQIDHTTGEMLWIRGAGGSITNGVQKTNQGLLWIQNSDISAREGSTYALLMTEGSNIGRCVIEECRFFGAVAGRRGIAAWEIRACRNAGIPDTFGTVPYRLAESVAGVPLEITQLTVEIDSEIAGAVCFSDNNLTSAAGAYISIQGQIRSALDFSRPGFGAQTEQTERLHLFKACNAGTLLMGFPNGNINLEGMPSHPNVVGSQDGPVGLPRTCAILGLFDYSGVASVDLSFGGGRVVCDNVGSFSVIQTEGTAAMSGLGTVTGSAIINATGSARDLVSAVRVSTDLTGGLFVTGAGAFQVGGGIVQTILFESTIAGGVPVVTVSKNLDAFPGISEWRGVVLLGTASAVSIGTYTISGETIIRGGSSRAYVANPGALFTGDLVVSGGVVCLGTVHGDPGFPVGNNWYLNWAGGTATVSGDVHVRGTEFIGSLVVVEAAGGTARITGDVSIADARCLDFRGVFATGAGATAGLAGELDITYFDCTDFFTVMETGNAGATAEGPTFLSNGWSFTGGVWSVAIGPGTHTLVGGIFFISHSLYLSPVTVSGDFFAVVAAFQTHFEADPIALTNTGSAPADYLLIKCSWRGFYAETGFPLVLDEYEVYPSAGALAPGILVDMNAAGAVIAAVAGTTRTEGVLVNATAGAGDPCLVMRRGRMFVDSSAAIVSAGLPTILDVVTPPQQTTGALVVGNSVGRSLEAVGTTNAGQAYTAVDMR